MQEIQTIVPWKHRLEKDFTIAWLKTLKVKGYYCDKISDWSVGNKLIDCYIVSTERFYVCEVKIINKDTFSLSKLRPNQWSALRRADNLIIWTSIVVVYSKLYNKYKIIPFSKIKDLNKNDLVKINFD